MITAAATYPHRVSNFILPMEEGLGSHCTDVCGQTFRDHSPNPTVFLLKTAV